MPPARDTGFSALLLAILMWDAGHCPSPITNAQHPNYIDDLAVLAKAHGPMSRVAHEDLRVFSQSLIVDAHPIAANGSETVRGLVSPQGDPPNLKDSKLIAEGESAFAQSCSIPYCHGKDGSAGRAPALKDRPWEAAQLQKIISEGIPATAMPSFNDKLSSRQIQAVIAYLLSISRAAAQEAGSASIDTSPRKSHPALSELPENLIGNPARGEELFFASGKNNEKACAACHNIDGRGNSVGPDLTGSAKKNPRELLRDIVFPGALVDPAYRTLRITMKDGERVLGLKREETAAGLRVYDISGNPPVLRRLLKEQIQNIETESHSAMPPGYGEIYTLRQLLDLLSFLKSSKISFADIQ